MKNLKNEIENISTKDEFLKFVEFLKTDFKNNPDSWVNKTLSDYLEGISSWTEDMEGYYKYNNSPIPENIPWNVFANILLAAKMYE